MSVLSQSGGRSADFQALVNHFKNSAEPPLEETKKCAKNCLNLTEYEKIPFANIIQENRVHEDDLVMLITAFDLLLKYATNLLKPKLPSLWRTVPVTSSTFKARVDCMKGARDILKQIGYSVETENALKFPEEQVEPDRDKLAEIAAEILMAKVEIEEMVNNPERPARTTPQSQAVGFGTMLTPSAYTLPPSAYTPPPSAYTLPPSNNTLPPSGYTLPPSGYTVTPSGYTVTPSGYTLPPSGNTVTPVLAPVPPVPRPRRVVPKTADQLPGIDEHRKKLDEIRQRHQRLCYEPQHPVSMPDPPGAMSPADDVTSFQPAVSKTGLQFAPFVAPRKLVPIKNPIPPGNMPKTTPPGDIQMATPPGDIQMATPPGDIPRATHPGDIPRATPPGDIPRATPPGDIPRATLEEANREVINYRKTQDVSLPMAAPSSLPSMQSTEEGEGHEDDGERILPTGQKYKDYLKEKELYFKKSQRKKPLKLENDIPEADPIMACNTDPELETTRNGMKSAGMKLLWMITELAQEGYSPDEVQMIMKYHADGRGLEDSKAHWNSDVQSMQDWVGVYNRISVGSPSRQDAVRFLLKNMGNIERAVDECYQERHDKITSLINKLKPFMAVPWEAATAALCGCDMDVQKAAWALQRDSLVALYEFINSEQEWAKVKQSDMSEIKSLLKGGGWWDDKAPLRLLVGECKFEDTERANIVVQLMNDLDKDYELQFYVNAARDHKTYEEAKKFIIVDCPICMGDNLIVDDMLLMPGCPHSVCKECFRDHFTNVMKTQTVKHFNCPVCAQPDMSNRDADQDMYQELLVTMVKEHTSREVTEICSQKLRDHNLSKDPNFCWCSNDECHIGFINETGRDKNITCPSCKKEMCFRCKKPWEKPHEGLTCDQFAQWKHDNDPHLQQQGLAAHLEANGIECPSCHNRYDLARGGCMHFKCTQCPNEFCSGCGQSFKQGQACKKFASCAKRGLHAHHPRDCLFFLRDFTVQELQGFLETHKVPFDKEPPKAQLEAAAKEANGKAPQLRCSVMLQKESVDGPKDEPCGKDAVGGCAGLCSVHYTEYLVTKINKAHLDPISLYAVNNLEAMLGREEQQVPEKEENEAVYKEKLIKHIQQVLPLEHTLRNVAATAVQ